MNSNTQNIDEETIWQKADRLERELDAITKERNNLCYKIVQQLDACSSAALCKNPEQVESIPVTDVRWSKAYDDVQSVVADLHVKTAAIERFLEWSDSTEKRDFAIDDLCDCVNAEAVHFCAAKLRQELGK